ncbi:MAG: hypothetical protein KDD44_05110 [Bdellovibrionales bacterium]|nr:hypothetical protein [Bdellovibrionales bacterium]
MSDKKLLQSLLALDFTDNDARVYLSLLELGPCAAGPLIKQTQFHRNVVYTSLDRLIARKLASARIVRGTKHFAATDPQRLAEDFSDRAKIAKAAARELAHRKTALAQEITVHQGNDEFLSLLLSTIRSMRGGTGYVLGAGGEAFLQHTMLPIWEPYHREAERLNITIRLVCYENQREEIEPHTKTTSIYRVRYLDQGAMNPAGIQFYPSLDLAFHVIYPDESNPVTAIRIVNRALVGGYKNLFDHLWKIGSR